MDRTQAIERIKDVLGDQLLGSEEKSAERIFFDVSREAIPAISRVMFEELGARLQTATGVDTPTAMEVLYHWAMDRVACVMTVRTRLNRDDPEVDSIAAICPAAEWIERELHELLGIRIINHPDLRHLLLGDDWPAGKYPLRRDYER